MSDPDRQSVEPRSTEASSHLSEAELTALLSASADVVRVLDAEGRYLKVVPTNDALLSRAPGEVLGNTLHQVFPAARADEFLGLIRRALEARDTVRVEYPLDIGGTETWFAAAIAPMGADRVVWVARDITEHRRADEQLREAHARLGTRVQERTAELARANAALAASEARFRGLVESAPDSVAAVGPDGRILLVNARTEACFGYRREELIGQPVEILVPERVRLAHAQRRAEYLSRLSGRPMPQTLAVFGRRKDGGEFPAEVSLSLTEAGEERPIICIIRDVTRRTQAAEALRRTNQLLERLFSNPQFMVAYLDADLNFVRVNPAYALADGRPLEFFPGKNHFALYPHPENEAIFRRVVATGQAYTAYAKPFEYPEHPERGVTYWDWSLQPVSESDGTVSGLIFTLADVTERVRAEAARIELARKQAAYAEAEAARSRIATILESITDAFFALDAEWRFTFVNREATRLTQRSSSDLLGQSFWEVFPEMAGSHFDVELRRAMAEPVTVEFTAYYAPLHAWFGVRAYHSAEGLSVYFQDITGRKRSEVAQRFLVEASGILASSLDVETTLARVGQMAVPWLADWCFVDLLDADGEARRVKVAYREPAWEALAREASRHPPGAHPDSVMARALQTGEPVLMPTVPRIPADDTAPPGATPHWMEAMQPESAMVLPLLARGRVMGALTFLSSASGRRYDSEDLALAEELARRAAMAVDNARLYREAQEAAQMREQFLAVASHELRTPMTVLRGFTEALVRIAERAAASQPAGEGADGPATVTLDRAVLTNALLKVDRSIGRLQRLIDELLDVTRLLQGRLNLSPERVDLSSLLARAVDDTRLKLERTRGGLESLPRFELRTTGSVWGSWDPVRLEQVATNLLDNAVKYSPSGGTVVAHLTTEDDGAAGGRCAHLVIRDQGMGIPKEEQENVFQPFVRGTNVSARHYSGMGMGLAITKGIVERHGGRVWVESEGPDRGSVFHVLLPGAEAA